jgi:hypothetical protein
MIQSYKEITSLFEKYCDEYRKLYLPAGTDDSISKTLFTHYSKYYSLQILDDCIRMYVRNTTEPVLIYNFALESNNIRDHVTKEAELAENFNNLLEQTRERMQRFNES